MSRNKTQVGADADQDAIETPAADSRGETDWVAGRPVAADRS